MRFPNLTPDDLPRIRDFVATSTMSNREKLACLGLAAEMAYGGSGRWASRNTYDKYRRAIREALEPLTSALTTSPNRVRGIA